ncbi:methyltransferase family protein [Streptohalobacillus salinus]|uniref:Methyltransferase family protein n=1 Tax=Streptohalobacillus salinus TaxID=621096 RepID=A0A2V3WAX2_9BACI|nr:methyltransferase domain-containing protein [Streptohalobacillus salinus]PXW91603.1 methyltransferase family protein [Streptohalobacillus salinus]
MAYQQLAVIYDLLMEDTPYQEWLAFTKKHLKPSARRVLDLGCGTGKMSVLLSKAGYQMTGVDLSEDMLVEASQRALTEKQSIQWIQQDMTALEGFNNYDAVVSYLDVVNYLPDLSSVTQVFSNVYHALNDSGVFLFDVHSMGHVEKMVNEIYSVVDERYSYIWFCEPGQYPGAMRHDLTFFIQDGELYQRFDEVHQQRTFTVSAYMDALRQVGFKAVHLYQDFEPNERTLENIDNEDARFFFVAKK